MNRHLALVAICGGVLLASVFAEHENTLRIAPFSADVTPPIGSPLCFGNVREAQRIETPLTARGLILLGNGEPLVLCVVDFVVLANESHDAWRAALSEAAGTTPDRVAMHVLHNHDSPGYDLGAMTQLEKRDLPDVSALRSAHEKAIEDTAAALRSALKNPRRVTRVGLGSAPVEKFASNRRIIGDDGKLVLARMSSCRNEEAIAEPEGTIDPELSLISFWDEAEPVAALTFYASHPQSYYGRGGVTPDTVGLARNRRTEETGAFHIHFDGAGGDVAAGKYNDGSPEARAALTARAHEGMRSAWEAQKRVEISADDIGWTVAPARLPKGRLLDEERLAAELSDPETPLKTRIRAARDFVYLRRWREGHEIDIGCLRLGEARTLFFPGELFVEYQLTAKSMRPGDFVAVAAYGDGGPGYIGTDLSYGQGGYEVGRVSRTAPGVEEVLHRVMRRLLEIQ